MADHITTQTHQRENCIMATTSGSAPGTIEPAVLYKLDELKRRAGLGNWAFRTARKNGLKVRYLANRAFVKGSDFIDFVERVATDAK